VKGEIFRIGKYSLGEYSTEAEYSPIYARTAHTFAYLIPTNRTKEGGGQTGDQAVHGAYTCAALELIIQQNSWLSGLTTQVGDRALVAVTDYVIFPRMSV